MVWDALIGIAAAALLVCAAWPRLRDVWWRLRAAVAAPPRPGAELETLIDRGARAVVAQVAAALDDARAVRVPVVVLSDALDHPWASGHHEEHLIAYVTGFTRGILDATGADRRGARAHDPDVAAMMAIGALLRMAPRTLGDDRVLHADRLHTDPQPGGKLMFKSGRSDGVRFATGRLAPGTGHLLGYLHAHVRCPARSTAKGVPVARDWCVDRYWDW